jgi:hypothetical protein
MWHNADLGKSVCIGEVREANETRNKVDKNDKDSWVAVYHSRRPTTDVKAMVLVIPTFLQPFYLESE